MKYEEMTCIFDRNKLLLFICIVLHTQWVGCEGGLMQRQEPRTTFQPLTNLQPSPRSWHPFISSSSASIEARLSTWNLHFGAFHHWPLCWFCLLTPMSFQFISPFVFCPKSGESLLVGEPWNKKRCQEHSVTFLKMLTWKMPEYVCIKVLHKQMSNILTNTCPNIFVQTNLTQTNALRCIEMSELKPLLL